MDVEVWTTLESYILLIHAPPLPSLDLQIEKQRLEAISNPASNYYVDYASHVTHVAHVAHDIPVSHVSHVSHVAHIQSQSNSS